MLASTVAAVTMGPVAIWPGHLPPPVPHQHTQPRQPAATHTPKPPRTAEQLYAVAAALLADGGESFIHHHGPASVISNIPGPQDDTPHPWRDTLRGRTRIRVTNGEAPPPGPQQGEAFVVQAAGYQASLHRFPGGYRLHVLADGN